MGIDQLKDRCRGCGAILQRRRSCEVCAGNQRARLHAAGVAVAEGGWRRMAPHITATATAAAERIGKRIAEARKQMAHEEPAVRATLRYLSLFAKPHEVGIDNCICWQCERQRWAHIPRTDEIAGRREYFCKDERGNPVQSWPGIPPADDQAAWDAAFNAELAPDLQRRKALRDQLTAPPRLQELADARARRRS